MALPTKQMPLHSSHHLQCFQKCQLSTEEEDEELSVPKSEPVPQQLEEEKLQEDEEGKNNHSFKKWSNTFIRSVTSYRPVWICVLVHPRELTNEEKEQIVHSEDFLFFFDRSIRVVERVLAEDTDIFFDYSGRDMEDKEGSERRLT